MRFVEGARWKESDLRVLSPMARSISISHEYTDAPCGARPIQAVDSHRSRNCSWSKHPKSTDLNTAQQIGRNFLKAKALKILGFREKRKSALQAGGQRFESAYLQHFFSMS